MYNMMLTTSTKPTNSCGSHGLKPPIRLGHRFRHREIGACSVASVRSAEGSNRIERFHRRCSEEDIDLDRYILRILKANNTSTSVTNWGRGGSTVSTLQLCILLTPN